MGAGDEDGLKIEAGRDKDRGIEPFLLGVETQSGYGKYQPLWIKLLQFGLGGPNEQAAREVGVPRLLGDHADCQSMFRVSAGDGVEDEQFMAVGVVLRLLEKPVEYSWGYRPVDFAPINLAFNGRVANYIFVVR